MNNHIHDNEGYCVFSKYSENLKNLPKILLAMKLTVSLILIACLHLQAAVYSQQINLSLKEVPLENVIKEIRKQTGYAFFYDSEYLQQADPISINVKKASIEETLRDVFKGQKFTWEILGKTILIKPIIPDLEREYTKAVQQALTIQGKVKESNGEPLAGVNVRVKGTSTGTVSDAMGNYLIKVSNADAVLVFSFLGFVAQEIKVAENRVIDVSLNEEVKTLNQVVVVGYDAIERKDLTGAVSSIQADEIAQSQSLTFQEALQGKMAGVQISSSSGEPGTAMNISIRGSNTIYGGTSPLYVIDDVPYDVNADEVASAKIDDNYGGYVAGNPLAGLNPQDIESINVLKDASATAIYGSRGANGVIIITTKSGKAGRMNIEYNGTSGFSEPIKKLSVLEATDYIDYRRVVTPNSSLFYVDTNGDGLFNELDEPRDPYAIPFHNWQDEILRTGFSHTHNLSFSGGKDGTTYSGSAGYANQQTILMNNAYNRYNVRLRVDHSHKRFKIGINLKMGYTVTEGATNLGIIQNLSFARPLEYYNEGIDLVDRYISPISMIDASYRETSLLRDDISTYASYKLNNNFTLKNTLGGFLSASKGKEFYSSETTQGRAYNGVGILQDKKTYSWFNTTQLNYTKRFNKDHLLQGMAAFEFTRYNYEDFNLRNTNFLDESTGVDDISKGSVMNNIGSNRDISNRISYFGRLNYTLLNRHLFTATFRADGSDKFGGDNRFGYFPSFAYAWRLSEERFIEKWNLFSDLKMRLSYGETGNERIPSFRYLATLENAYYNGELGLAPASMANRDLKWETTVQYNAGLDVGFAANRVLLNIDFYNKQTNDMLLPAYVPTRTGFVQQWQNFGRVDNKGVEFSVTTVNVDKQDFKWTTNLNISANKNRVRRIGDVGFITVNIPGELVRDQGRVMEGGSIGDFYGYMFDGIYQINDFTWQDNSDPDIPHADRTYTLREGVVNQTGVNVLPGSLKFKDLNSDGAIDLDNDRTVIGRSFPKHFGGLNNTINYKNFDLNVFFDWSYGNQLFNLSKYRLEGGVYSTWQNILQDFWFNRWTPDNPTDSYGDITSYNAPAQFSSSYYVEDASWLRLRNVSLGYRFSSTSFINTLGIDNLRLFFTGTNLATWTKYSGYDPEVSSNNPLLPGVDRISYPRTKSFLFGLNATF